MFSYSITKFSYRTLITFLYLILLPHFVTYSFSYFEVKLTFRMNYVHKITRSKIKHTLISVLISNQDNNNVKSLFNNYKCWETCNLYLFIYFSVFYTLHYYSLLRDRSRVWNMVNKYKLICLILVSLLSVIELLGNFIVLISRDMLCIMSLYG